MTNNSSALVLHNGKIKVNSTEYGAIAIVGNKIADVGFDADILKTHGEAKKIDLHRRRVIPGLNDSHIHLIRGGLNFNLELRWDGLKSLADALEMLKQQVAITPTPQWVRVVGGFSEFQFKERRLPTIAELNAIAPNTPVFILHLYDRAILNAAALRSIGYDRHTPEPPGGEIQRDEAGNPTGLLVARPNATILYATLAKGPKLSFSDQYNSTRYFMRDLNRLGVTSVIDAGGGYQYYPEDYAVINKLHDAGDMTVRIAYNLFSQHPHEEKSDFERWVEMTKPGAGDRFLRMNGAGEMLVYSAADFEDFREPRPDLPANMETDLEAVVEILVKARWPFRLHATYNESIGRALDVFERVNKKIEFDGLRWFFDHAETVTETNIERIKALGGGIAIQHRMAFQGEYFVERYGRNSAKHTPPIRKMLAAGLPVGAGTDATRVASYNPFVSLKWLVTGETVGGLKLYEPDNLLDREEALRLYTEGSAWFSGEESIKGSLKPGALADLAVLSGDFFTVPSDEIDKLESVLTIVDGRIVYGASEFSDLSPNLPEVTPSWSPVHAEHSSNAHSSFRTCLHSQLKDLQSLLNPTALFSGCHCFAF